MMKALPFRIKNAYNKTSTTFPDFADGKKHTMVIEAFEDYNDISEWAKEYVNGIYANKIMIGVSDTRFAAQENLTKAQAATLLTRIIKLIEGEE